MKPLQPLSKLNTKEFSKVLDENPFVAKAELRALCIYTRRLTQLRASYQVKLKALVKNGMPRSDAAYEASEWFIRQIKVLEAQAEKLVTWFVLRNKLTGFVEATPGLSLMTMGVLLGSLDINNAPVAGSFWIRAGLDPQRRGRHDRDLKRACWLLGESLLRRNAYYRRVYNERRVYETLRNVSGAYSDDARLMLEQGRYSPKTNAYQWIAGRCDPDKVKPRLHSTLSPLAADCLADDPDAGLPMLPPLAIHFRARRYAVKVFLAHFHHYWHVVEFGVPPKKPYVLHLRHMTVGEPPQLSAISR